MGAGDYLSIKFRMDGKDWEDSQPVYAIATGLLKFQHLVDNAWLTHRGRKRMTRRERIQCRLLAQHFRTGSFETDLQLFIHLTAPVLPIITTLAPSQIWETMKGGFEFLKVLADLRRKGEDPTIEQNGSGNIAISGDGNIVAISPSVYNFTLMSENSLEKLARLVRDGDADSLQAIDESGEGVLIDQPTAELLLPEHVPQDPGTVVLGGIVEFNKEKRTGKFRVSEDQPVAARTYPFSLGDPEARVENYIEKMKQPEVEVLAQVILEKRPSGAEKPVKMVIYMVD